MESIRRRLNVPSSSSKKGRDGADGSESAPEAGCASHPSSPRLSGKLGKVTVFLSRSDANIGPANNSKSKRSRHDSGDSTESNLNTPEEGSPSRGSSLMAKATGYVTHLKSRLGKHRDRVREDKTARDLPSQTFSACCGSKRQVESSDTLAGYPGTSSVPSMVDSAGSAAEGSASISVNVSCSTATHSEFDETLTATPIYTTSHRESEPKVAESSPAVNMTQNPSIQFYTLNVHLLRGKNLVAKDSCGTSDPYVKVKIGDKMLFKSKTIYKDLSPTWDESFVLPINDMNEPIVFKVFDYDWGFQDDFMGMASVNVSRLSPNKATDMTLTLTETGLPTAEAMGEIFISVTLVPRTIEEKEIFIKENPLLVQKQNAQRSKKWESLKWFGDGQSGARLADTQRRLKSQIWSSVLTVLLLEAKNINHGEDRVLMDAFVKFRLGSQKYKTRTLARTTSPKWIEQFDFYLYEGQPQILEVQVFDEAFSKDYIGRCAIDIGLLEKETTHEKTFPLQEGPGEISFLLTISGTAGLESISDLTNYNPSPEDGDDVKSQYSLRNSLNCLRDVGHLTVKVYEAQGLVAADIGGKSDPFCVLELCNARLQTQTEYRTLTPVWNKIFTFAVKDITSVLEVTVYDEDKNHKQEFLGKLNIPLWKIKNGEKKWHMLKDPKLIRPAKGNNPQILLELDLMWNPIRAGIRVMDPPECKFILPDQRLKREVFLHNLDRLKRIGISIYDVMQYVQSCVEWEYPLRSIIALVLYQVLCYTFEPYMIPLILMILILRQWLVSSITGAPLIEEVPEDEDVVMDDDDEDGETDEKKMTLREKLQAVQDATQMVQNTLGDIASICESGRNTFRMAIPFISWLSVLGLFIGTVVLFFVPVRYLAMAWGLHRFLRPILRPNVVPTNELYNLIIRVPDNQQLLQYKPLRPAPPPVDRHDPQKTRSPPGKQPPAAKKKYKFW